MGRCQKVAICIAMLVGTMVVSEPIPGGDEVHREKRQIERAPFDPLPTFPPDTERTADGVPIIEGSYLDRADRPAARFFSQFEKPYPTSDSEGLRLYEDLWTTRGRNQPRSLDSSYPFGENGIQPHHRQSAAWSTRKETKRYSSSRSAKSIQTRSGGSLNQDDDLPVEVLPSGFGPSTGPKFSEEVTYRRSNGGRRGANLQTKSLSSGTPGYSCVTCRRSSSSSNGHSGSSHQLRSLGHNSEEVSSSGANANSEGLRIYNKWLSQSSLLGTGSTASRNQLRSLDTDNEDDLLGQPTSSWPASDNNGILPHHRKSAAWTRREERRHSSRRSSKTITVRSGGGASDLPPIATTTSTPQFSEEVTYRRNGGGASSASNNQLQTRSLDTSASRIRHGGGSTNGLTCVLCRGRGSTSSSSSHNQLRSLDQTAEQTSSWNRQPPQSIIVPPPVATTPAAPIAEGGVQTHSSWAENEERRQHSSRTHSSSGSSGVRHIPSGGEVVITDLENISPPEPEHQSEEITYRREAAGGSGGVRRGATASAGCLINNGHSSTDTSSTTDSSSRRATNCTRIASSRRRSNGHHSRSEHSASAAETRSLSSASEGAASRAGCRRCDTSRIASSNSLRTLDRDTSYPPVQTIGRGDNTVDARILRSSHEEDEENAEAASGGQLHSSSGTTASGGKFKKAYYRRTVFKNYTTGDYPPTIQTWLGA